MRAVTPRERLRPAAAPGSAAVGAPGAGAACHGFALITVLWLVVVLASLVALGLAGTRLGQQTTANRVLLTRARWAAEACAAIAQARWSQHARLDTGTIDLGRETRCRWRFDDPTTRVNVNTVDREVLSRLIGDSLAGLIITRRQGAPFESNQELAAVDTMLSVEGPGTINANVASARILLALPGLGPEAVERLESGRLVGRPISSLDALAGAVSLGARSMMLEHYADLARVLTFSAPQLLLTGRGWVGSSPDPEALVASIELLVVPLPERLAVIRRRVRG